MKKNKLWDIFVNKNPHWKTNGANLTPDGLKKLFDTIYDRGYREGGDDCLLATRSDKSKTTNNDIMQSFSDIFGGKL